MKDYGPRNNKGYRNVPVEIDNFSKIGWSLPLKNKNAQTIKDSFEKILIGSNRKPKIIETDRGKEFYNNIFQKFLIITTLNFILEKHTLGLFLQRRFNHTMRAILKRPVFEKSDGNWVDI